jgi:hypothetical protein
MIFTRMRVAVTHPARLPPNVFSIRYLCVCVYVCVCVNIYICVCVCVCVYVCMYVYKSLSNMHVYNHSLIIMLFQP